MNPMIAGTAFVLALLCAAAMGLAIQRGTTCTVAAVEEWRTSRRTTRLAAMVEASLWVCAGVMLARQLGHAGAWPAGYAVSRWTGIGAALLGLGAVLNQACVFGTVARLGSGQWVYAATPLGFYLGCVSVGAVFSPPRPLPVDSPLAGAPPWWPGLLMAGLLGLVLWRAWRARAAQRIALSGAWSPHTATTVIGLSFAGLLLLAGAWTYTDVLQDLARGMAASLLARGALGLAVLVGAIVGGWSSGTLRPGRFRASALLRCSAGGLLMGWGGALIPGGNDGLVLLGMPMLWPYAWVAFGTMVAVIAAALQVLAPR